MGMKEGRKKEREKHEHSYFVWQIKHQRKIHNQPKHISARVDLQADCTLLTIIYSRWLSGLSAFFLLFETEWACSVGKTDTPIFHLFSASDPHFPINDLWSLSLWSAQNTLPNARWVPDEHVLISRNLYPLLSSSLFFRITFAIKGYGMKLNAFRLVSNVAATEDNTFLRHVFSSKTKVAIRTTEVRVLHHKSHSTHTL